MNQSNGRGLRCVTERTRTTAAKSTLEQLRESGKEGGEARGEQAWLGILLVFASCQANGRPTAYEGKYGFLFESTRGYFAELYVRLLLDGNEKAFPYIFQSRPRRKI